MANIGAVAAALMASSCCWLPLLLLALGLSGARITSALETYRPLSITLTFGFLAAAFYFTYGPQRAATGAGHGRCAGKARETCCEPAPKRRFDLMSLNKAMLWAVTAMAVAFLYFPHYIGLLLDGGDCCK